MTRINLPLLQILIALCIGITGYNLVQISQTLLHLSIACSIGILLVLHWIANKKIFSELPFILGVFTVFVGLGYLASEHANDLKDPTHYTNFTLPNEEMLLISIEEQLKPTQYQQKYVAKIHKVGSHISSGKILMNLTKDSLNTSVEVGDWFYTHAKILPLPIPKNPYSFNYGDYLKTKNMYGQLSLSGRKLLRSQRKSTNLRVWSSSFRESVQEKIKTYSFSKSQRTIIEALLLGQKQNIDKEITSQYAAAGMMHILAVSGLHVGIILLLLRFITRPISTYRLKWLRSGIIIILIWSLAFITGMSPSVLRAATMFSFLEIGTAMGGKQKSVNATIASAIFLLLYNPLLIYQVGFQLSYLAVFAILWIQPWLSHFYKPRFWIDRLLWGTATVTAAAQIGVMPLSLFYFHQFPGLFFVSNIVILPFLALIIALGVLVVLLASLNILPTILVSFYGGVIDLMNGFIGWVASQESFIGKHISLSIALLITSYVLLISFISLCKKSNALKWTIATVSVLLFTTIWIFEKRNPEYAHLAILNQNKTTSIMQLENNTLKIFNRDSIKNIENDYRINSYRDALPIKSIDLSKLSNYFIFNQRELLIVDSLAIYNMKNAQPDYILLTQSPKLNLDRLIDLFPNTHVIADASNYRSYIERWRQTCLKRKIPFHNTYEKGAFIIK